MRFIIVLLLWRNIFSERNLRNSETMLAMPFPCCCVVKMGFVFPQRLIGKLCPYVSWCWYVDSSLPPLTVPSVPETMVERNSCRIFLWIPFPWGDGAVAQWQSFGNHVGGPVFQPRPHKANNLKPTNLNPSTTSHWMYDLQLL